MTQVRPTIAVTGGGITGLAAAYRLTQAARQRSLNLEVRLFEASGRPGGVIHTDQTDGFLLEGGPDSFISEKPWALNLSKELDLDPRLIGTNPDHCQVFIARQGRLLPIPEGFHLISPSRFWPFLASPIFSWPGKLRMGLELLIPSKKTEEDETVGAFVRRRFGREAVERIAQPMVGGIYTADVNRLSLRATMPQFLQMEKQYGSLIRAVRRRQKQMIRERSTGARYDLFFSFDRGMQVLVDALQAALPAGTLCLNSPVQRIQHNPTTNRWIIHFRNNERMETVGVCVALPAPKAAGILEEDFPDLAGELRAISYVSSATVNLTYEKSDVPHPLEGFGFVVPPAEGRSILACTFSSMKFPGRAPEGKAVLRAFLGGALQPEMANKDDETMVQAVREDLRFLLGITRAPSHVSLHRHADSMPQYTVGHLDRVSRIEKILEQSKGLALAGNAYRGVGIPDCIHSGEQASDLLLAKIHLSYIPVDSHDWHIQP